MFSLNNQEFSQYTAEIYPKELTYKKSNLNGHVYLYFCPSAESPFSTNFYISFLC